MSDFYKYFKENMDGLGLPAPESLFGNVQLATATASTLIGLAEKFGKTVTVAEMIGAGIRGEKLMVVGAMSAAQMNHLHRPWLPSIMMRHPEIYKKRRVIQTRRGP